MHQIQFTRIPSAGVRAQGALAGMTQYAGPYRPTFEARMYFMAQGSAIRGQFSLFAPSSELVRIFRQMAPLSGKGANPLLQRIY